LSVADDVELQNARLEEIEGCFQQYVRAFVLDQTSNKRGAENFTGFAASRSSKLVFIDAIFGNVKALLCAERGRSLNVNRDPVINAALYLRIDQYAGISLYKTLTRPNHSRSAVCLSKNPFGQGRPPFNGPTRNGTLIFHNFFVIVLWLVGERGVTR